MTEAVKKAILISTAMLGALVLSAATAIYPVTNRVDAIKWDRLTNAVGQPDPFISGYRVYLYGTTPSTVKLLPATATGAAIIDARRTAISGQTNVQMYYVRVTAVGTNGLEGPLSQILMLP